MKKIIQTSTLFILTSILFLSCDSKKPAIGNEDEIFVFADSLEYIELEPVLLQIFGKTIYTPTPEQLFLLNWKDISEINSFQHRKNIIIIAPFNSDTETSKLIRNIVSPEVKSKIESDSLFVVNKYDLWSKDQLVMVLTSPSIEKLKYNILNNENDLVYFFQKISDKRLLKSIYNPTFENEKQEAEFLKKYDWLIYVQKDFVVAKDDSLNNFVWLRRSPGSNLERWVSIHWIDNASPAFLNPDSIYKERNRLTEFYFRTMDNSAYVEIADDYLSSTDVNFNGKYAIFTQGLWRMNDKSMGGPFINYTFYDEKSKRIYMLDGSIFAPKFYKKSLIQQVDVILQSFKPGHEINENKREDLLDLVD